MAIKVKKVNKELTPRQEANKLARELGGKFLNAAGYNFVQEGYKTENFKSIEEFLFIKGGKDENR
jgi:hypothetical protein